jgi:hypothetical protein
MVDKVGLVSVYVPARKVSERQTRDHLSRLAQVAGVTIATQRTGSARHLGTDKVYPEERELTVCVLGNTQAIDLFGRCVRDWTTAMGSNLASKVRNVNLAWVAGKIDQP